MPVGANVISRRSPCYPFSRKPAANERLDKHVFAHCPDLVIVSYGLNDARGGTPSQLFKEEMTSLVRSIRRGTHALIVLMGPYYIKRATVRALIDIWHARSIPHDTCPVIR